MDIKIDEQALDNAINRYQARQAIEHVFDGYYDSGGRDIEYATKYTLLYLLEHSKKVTYSLKRYMRLTNGGIHTMTTMDFFVTSAFRISPDLSKRYITLKKED